MLTRTLLVVVAALAAASLARADWNNLGGNNGRTGQAVPVAADTPATNWTVGKPSIIAWHPVIEGDRVFLVRQTSFVPNNVPNDALVVCMNVVTGEECWSRTIPYNNGDWTPVVFGVKNGRLYAGRSGNGGSVLAKLYCLDVNDGHTLWTSTDVIATGAYDGIAFADNGDPIVGWHLLVRRISFLDGSTVWNTPRSCSVSGDCGPAVNGNFVYVDEVAVGGQIVTKIDIATGQKLYSTPVMPGFLTQTTPMVGSDGTVYYNRIQNNQAVDFFYCFDDNGTSFTERWKKASGYAPSGGYGLGPDGSVYIAGVNKFLHRLDGQTGDVLDTSALPMASAGEIIQPHFAIDGDAKVYVSNGAFNEGHIWCYEADLTPRWDVAFPAVNQGGPAIAGDGTVIVAGTGTTVKAFAPPERCASADLDCDGLVGPADLAILLGAWGRCRACDADLDGDGSVGPSDLAILLGAWS